MSLRLVLLFSIWCLALPCVASVSIPHSMSALGDSTTTGTLAQYHLKSVRNPIVHIQAILEFIRFGITGANKFSLSDWNLSWSTGIGSKKVLSHAARIKKLNPSLSISNFAVPGANVENVWKVQIPQLKQWSQISLKKNYPDYVTLFVGANDICADSLEESTSSSKFVETYEKILLELLKSSQTTRVLVLSLPPYEDLTRSSQTRYIGYPLSKCSSFWNIAPVCKSITHGDEKNTLKVGQKINSINYKLQSLVNRLNRRFKDRVRIANKIAERHIEPKDLSLDCFHPNDTAQNDISELSWSSTWWAKP